MCTCRPPLNDSPSVLSLPVLLSSLQLFFPCPFFFPPMWPTHFFAFSLPSPSASMLRHTMPSDPRYADATNPAVPQGSGIAWAPGLDTCQPAVTRDLEDRHGPSHLRANQLTSSRYASATPFSLTQRDSYPALGHPQSECPDQFPYPPQQYTQTVNYAAPSHDLADYPSVSYPFVLMTPPNIHQALFRSFQVMPTIAGSMPPGNRQWPTSSINPQILIRFNTRHMTTPQGTSPPTANTACRSAANIKIWSWIMQAICVLMILLIIMKLLLKTPPFPSFHHLDLLSWVMLW